MLRNSHKIYTNFRKELLLLQLAKCNPQHLVLYDCYTKVCYHAHLFVFVNDGLYPKLIDGSGYY
jgi:hypothetical protein